MPKIFLSLKDIFTFLCDKQFNFYDYINDFVKHYSGVLTSGSNILVNELNVFINKSNISNDNKT